MSEKPSKPTLPTFSWIGHLKEDDRDLLSSYGQFFPGHPGSVIIEKGVLQTEVFVVISGQLEVLGDQEEDEDGELGEPALLARVGPGETLGEMSLFDPAPATATVRASEFSQLWRIADSDLIQFMEQNPGAGNVLLRTLATILAQRLRQVDPAAFGLSAYAVVESPELEEQDAATGEALGEMPVDETAFAPSAGSLLTGATLTPKPAEKSPKVPGPEILPGSPDSTSDRVRKLRTGTQIIPDPDELEPL